MWLLHISFIAAGFPLWTANLAVCAPIQRALQSPGVRKSSLLWRSNRASGTCPRSACAARRHCALGGAARTRRPARLPSPGARESSLWKRCEELVRAPLPLTSAVLSPSADSTSNKSNNSNRIELNRMFKAKFVVVGCAFAACYSLVPSLLLRATRRTTATQRTNQSEPN